MERAISPSPPEKPRRLALAVATLACKTRVTRMRRLYRERNIDTFLATLASVATGCSQSIVSLEGRPI